MRPGLHTRGVMRLARIKTNKQKNNTLLFYILTFPNTDIQDFGFSKHWNSCTYSRTPLISDSGLWLFQTLELRTYSQNSHKWPLKIRKVSCRLREVIAYESRTAGCRLRGVCEDLSFLGGLFRGDFGGGLWQRYFGGARRYEEILEHFYFYKHWNSFTCSPTSHERPSKIRRVSGRLRESNCRRSFTKRHLDTVHF